MLKKKKVVPYGDQEMSEGRVNSQLDKYPLKWKITLMKDKQGSRMLSGGRAIHPWVPVSLPGHKYLGP